MSLSLASYIAPPTVSTVSNVDYIQSPHVPYVTQPFTDNISYSAEQKQFVLDLGESTLGFSKFVSTYILTELLKKLNIPIINVEFRQNPHLGTYIVVIIDADARQALEYWLIILDKLHDLKIPIFVMWTGKNDVKPEEMGRYIGKALVKMGVFLSTLEPIDSVKLLREED